MRGRRDWSHEEVLAAFALYLRTPFGRLHARNPDIVALAQHLGRTPAAVAMKCCNLASLDPSLRKRGIRGLRGISSVEREIWENFSADPEHVGYEAALAHGRMTGQMPPEDEEPVWAAAPGVDREARVRVRVNQYLFRQIILASYAERCTVCLLPLPKLLVASHIVPWSMDPGNRMNPCNGLCLCALHDRAYETGVLVIDREHVIHIAGEARRCAKSKAVQETLLQWDGKTITSPHRWPPDPELLTRRCEIVRVA